MSIKSINIHNNLLLARRSHNRVLEEQAALLSNPNQDWDWDLPEPPCLPVYQPALPGLLDYSKVLFSDEDASGSPYSFFADDKLSSDQGESSNLEGTSCSTS